MRFFIRLLQRRLGTTTLYVTHDQSESMVMSDRIVVMFDGRIHQIGRPEDIYYRPATREVASFIGQANLIYGTVVDSCEGVVILATAFGRLRCGTKRAVTAGIVAVMPANPFMTGMVRSMPRLTLRKMLTRLPEGGAATAAVAATLAVRS